MRTRVNRSRTKRIVFRILALLVGTLPFFAAELTCRWLGIGDPTVEPDPFVGFVSERPLFSLDDSSERYEIAENRYLCFQPDGFAATKSNSGFRIFCLGGSTVQGRPYSIETSFTTWLRLSLEAADADRDFEVVNCGGISYASYRLAVILDEVLQYEPDLIILYTGHNEFLEDRTYESVKQRPKLLQAALRWANASHLYNAASSVWHATPASESTAENDSSTASDNTTVLGTEVSARLDVRGGLQQYHRDEQWRNGVVSHFEFNLRSMVRKCQRAQVPVWLLNPVSNLADCRPFKSKNRDDIKAAETKAWEQLREEASVLFRGEPIRAVKQLEAAYEIDRRHAGLAYDLAKSYELVGRYDKAKQLYQASLDEDICPLRMISDLHDALARVAEQEQALLIDVQARFVAQSRDGIPGGDWLVDHVHPSIRGHQLIDDLLMESCFREGIVQRSESWATRRKELHRAHLESLDNRYYLQGQRRLEALNKWSRPQQPTADEAR